MYDPINDIEGIQFQYRCLDCGNERKGLLDSNDRTWHCPECKSTNVEKVPIYPEGYIPKEERCDLCGGSGEDPEQQGGLTKVCRVCGGNGRKCKE